MHILAAILIAAIMACSSAIQPLDQVFWMHIQKTSSWMGDFLLLWSCTDICDMYKAHVAHANKRTEFFYDTVVRHWNALPADCQHRIKTSGSNYGYHEPFSEHLKGMAVTLFRHPMDRLISAFLFNGGMMLPRGSPWKPIGQHVKRVINNTKVPIFTYASMPGVGSCQTKMILGQDCGTAVTITPTDVTKAIDIVSSPHQFAFVGLTEEPEASALLFLAMFGPQHQSGSSLKTDEYPLHLAKALRSVYSTSYRKNSKHLPEIHQMLSQQLRSSGWTDNADDQLYTAAADVFYRRCSEYNITTSRKRSST